MDKIKYNTKLSFSNKAYGELLNFLAEKSLGFGLETYWDHNGMGNIFYFDKEHEGAVKVSNKRFFGLVKRRVCLTDKVEQSIVDEIKNIIS